MTQAENPPRPKIIDLFAGAGGLSLGAVRAGFDLVAAIERDPHALETHRRNFPRSIHSDSDISNLTGAELCAFAGVLPGELDGLIGGPPCQGFSTIGRQIDSDSRNDLFVHFFKIVSEAKPKFFLAENVPGLLQHKHQKILDTAFSLVDQDYVLLSPIKVVASDYGAPTTRKRVFFVGYRPQYFERLTEGMFDPPLGVVPVQVKDALAGLPEIIDPNWIKAEGGWRPVAYWSTSEFGEHLRGRIPEGVGDPNALKRLREAGEVSGLLGTRHSPSLIQRYGSLRTGEMDSKTKSVRLGWDGFCPTLRAGTGSDKGSFQAVRPIHPEQPRVITPREAARLQGFPDWFVFHDTKWHSFRQIGNSVSPIVAEKLLTVLRTHLLPEASLRCQMSASVKCG